MRSRKVAMLASAVALVVLVHAVAQADKKKDKDKGSKGPRASVVGNLVCGRCAFHATPQCSVAVKLGEKQFVILEGKEADALFNDRKSGDLVRAGGILTVADGVAKLQTTKVAKSKKGEPQLGITGNLACSHCSFHVGESCGVGLKAGDLQVVLTGKEAQGCFADRKGGAKKHAVGTLTKIDGNTIFLEAAEISDPRPKGKKSKGS